MTHYVFVGGCCEVGPGSPD